MAQNDLLTWPYNSEAASRLLDPELIEQQGHFFLRRALNIRRLVVFAGSGLSMAYGRVSWVELAETQITGILNAKRAFEVSQKKLGENERNPIKQPLEQLLARLEGIRKAISDDATDVIVLSLQLAEQVWLLAEEPFVKSLMSEFQVKGGDRSKSEEGRRELFRECIKAETYDERHHAKRILSDPFATPSTIDVVGEFANKSLSHDELERFPTQRQPELDRLFSSDVISVLEQQGEKLESQGSEAMRPLYSFGRQIAQLLLMRSPGGSLGPINYPGVGLALDAIRAGYRLDSSDAPPPLDALHTSLENACKGPSGEAVRERFVARDRDPLWILAMNLEVKRFITTNYDLDIERLIDDLGFKPTAYESQAHLVGEQVERIGPMGGRARDIVLGKGNAAEMIDFACGESPHHLQVMHVHGRATKHENIVVTERDYQNMYLGYDSNTIVAREGMQILFGGNPILFAGIGLSEGDLMRPLREFAMEHLRRNHSVVALAPATKDYDKRSQFVMDQYIRHGVYVLHYGFHSSKDKTVAKDKHRAKDRDKDKHEEVAWLECVFDFTKAIKSALEVLSTHEKFKKAYPDADKNPALTITEAAGEMLRKLGVTESNIDSLNQFATDDSTCSIALEISILICIGRFVTEDAIALRKRDERADGVVDTLFKTILPRAVKRTEDALRTIALSAYLRGLEKSWRKWAETWPKMPKTRSEEFNFSTLHDLRGAEIVKKLPAELLMTRWFRHLIVEQGVDENSRFEGLVNGWLAAPRQTAGRRLWLIAAPRGAGKGGLLGQLTRHGDFLLDAPRRISVEKHVPQHRYAAQFLMNFSFSSETSSAWDAFSAFLLNPREPVAHKTLGNVAGDTGPFGRIGRLRAALLGLKQCLKETAKSLRKKGTSVAPRCLVVFQAFDLLFEPDGYPKTAEIRAICDLLFGETGAMASIDIVLILKDIRIPLYFRRPGFVPLSNDRRNKCPSRSPRLIADPKDFDPESLASMIIKSGVQISEDRGDVTQAVRSLLPQSHVGGVAAHTYLSFLEPGDERSLHVLAGLVQDQNGSDLLRPLLSKNRLQLRLFHRVIEDIQAQLDANAANLAIHEFSLAVQGATNNQASLAPDRFFEKVLDHWQSRSSRSISDKGLKKYLSQHEIDSDTDLPELSFDFKIHELILRHLAVISTPVEADVLLVCPQLARRLNERRCTDKSARLHVVKCALLVLTYRGLVFAIHRRKVRDSSTRYQVHRALQLHIYRKLGAQNAEPADSYSFALSLFASQTRESPLLIANAYAFLHELMDELVDLPKPNGNDRGERLGDLHVRCLKAAMGVARTLFSIGVVARFDDLGGVRVPLPPKPGYFEHHRLILRWMILQASRIGCATVSKKVAFEAKASEAVQMPFYPDEIIWLFNECGVFSLAQGEMSDAVGMFEAALNAAETIEGRGNSPLRRRILLNLSLCSIYRGRPNDARRVLGEILNAEGEDEAVRLIAMGHMGLLDHIGGFHEAALRNLNTAIKGLTKLRRFRSVSMLLRHRGDLHRDLQDFPLAERDLAAAVDFARLSGSQDMVWFAIVAKTRLDVTKGTNLKNAARTLDDAERYADAMELPLLIAETCFVHAQMLLLQGETALAAEKVTRALRLATLHGLTLRSIAYRNLLADIHEERNWLVESKRIRGQALQAARNAGYRLMLQRNPQETARTSGS